MRRKTNSGNLGRPTAFALAAALVVTGFTALPAAADELVDMNDTPVDTAVEPTVSDVELAATEVATDYTDSPPVAEAEGDTQQRQLAEPTEDDENAMPAGVARVDLNSDIAVLGVSWNLGDEAPVRIESRSLIGGEWSSWTPLEIAPQPESADPAEITKGATEATFVTDATAVEVVAFAADGEHATDFILNVIDPRGDAPVENEIDPEAPGAQPEALDKNEPEVEAEPGDTQTESESDSYADDATPETAEPQDEVTQGGEFATPSFSPTLNVTGANVHTASTLTGLYPGLKINSRKAWGANERIRDKTPDRAANYAGAVVHHTAGGNNYTASQVPGIIRGIYSYHVGLGWGDIGYQLLVDKYGGVWEGRYEGTKRQLAGAQAYGANFETFGISVLGNFTSVAPTTEALKSTASAIAWMFDSFGVPSATGKIRVPGGDYRGRNVNVISGHRDIGRGTSWATACPGDPFYAKLSWIRTEVTKRMKPALPAPMKRFQGTDRFDTAAKVALSTYPSGADTVYVANGMDYPDALAGGAAAGAASAPVLLTQRTGVPSQTQAALKSLKPKRVIVLGGTGVISAGVATQLKNITGVTPTRYGGADRYATAASVALNTAPNAGTVYVASGGNFPDALSGVPIAGKDRAPLLLTQPTSVPSVTAKALQSIKPSKIIILGGTGVVSSRVEQSLKSVAPTERRQGANRFGTAANTAIAKYPRTVDTVYISTGMDFPDALAGGPTASVKGGPLLLAQQNSVPPETVAALKRMKPKEIVILGGVGPVSRLNEYRLKEYIVRR